MLQAALPAVALTLAWPSLAIADASFLRSADLLTACESPQAIDQGDCYGYISGVADAMSGNADAERRVCVPRGVSRGEIRDAVVTYLQQRRGAEQNASDSVAAALARSFRC